MQNRPLSQKDIFWFKDYQGKPQPYYQKEDIEKRLAWAKSFRYKEVGKCKLCGVYSSLFADINIGYICKDCLLSRAFGAVGGIDNEK